MKVMHNELDDVMLDVFVSLALTLVILRDYKSLAIVTIGGQLGDTTCI